MSKFRYLSWHQKIIAKRCQNIMIQQNLTTKLRVVRYSGLFLHTRFGTLNQFYSKTTFCDNHLCYILYRYFLEALCLKHHTTCIVVYYYSIVYPRKWTIMSVQSYKTRTIHEVFLPLTHYGIPSVCLYQTNAIEVQSPTFKTSIKKYRFSV